MQITNQGSRDLALTVWDLIPAGQREIIMDYPLNRGSSYAVPWLNQDGDGYNRIRYRVTDSAGNEVVDAQAYSRDADTVYVR
jgi:hypothetical protein